MFCKILTWLVTILLQDTSTLWQYMYEKHGYLFSYGKLAYKWVYCLCPIYKHSKNWTFTKALKNRCIFLK